MCQRLVKFKIRLISLIIHFFILRVWLMATCFFYSDGNGFIIIFIKSDSDTREDCGSKRCCCIGCRYNDRFACDIGFDRVQRREFAEPPIALKTSAFAPAASATSRLWRRESATPSMQARTIWPLVFAKSSP